MGKRLLMFPLPFQGHHTPMLQLAEILHSKGFSISIIHTHFNSPNSANHPQFSFYPIPNSLFKDEDCSADHVVEFLNMLNKECVLPFTDLLSQILSENNVATEDEEPVACLITDALWHFTQALADSFKLPRIVLRTSNLASFLSFNSLYLLKEKGYLSAQGSQFEAPPPELSPLKVKDIPLLCVSDPEAAYELVSKLLEKTKASRGVIFNSFEELEPSSLATFRKDISVPIFVVGPFHKQVSASSSSLLAQDSSCISWLNSQSPKSVLYVSFGSIAAVNEAEFVEIAWGLANSKQPFLWAIRPGLVRGHDGPAPLPNGFLDEVADRGLVITWAPQVEVLRHPAIGGFWTHNGWNSTLESISEGIPMFCLPCFADQMANARYVTDLWRVGLRIEDEINRKDIDKAIRRLMLEKEGREIAERVACLKEKADLCIAEGGSSYKSLDNLVAHILSF
uniref:UDP-glucosyl trnasferase 2 n=1 Tax=Sesuvium portulacastrum TaxID=221166 RepID=A0A2I7ZAU8_SESPO|nr:UDP-glucosyl trnasferase 2 [Sesuvium portulacastrum]